MPKHSAVQTAAKVASKGPSPIPVKAAVKGVNMVGRAKVANKPRLRPEGSPKHAAGHAAPDSSYSSGELAEGRNQDKPSNSGGGTGRGGTQTKYIPKTRASRTRYIRYEGKDEHDNAARLIGEWLLGVVLISISVPLNAGDKGYQKTIDSVMYRLTALTAVFFVLALMANTKGGKAAVWLGLLIDLGIVFNSVSTGTFRKIADIFASGTLSQGPGVVMAADITKPSPGITGPGFDNSSTVPAPSTTSNAPIPA